MAVDKEREEALRALTRAELVALANSQGMGIPEDATKDQVLGAFGVDTKRKRAASS